MGTALGHGRQNRNFRPGRIGAAAAAVMSMAVVVLPSGGSVSAASFVVTTTADTLDAAGTCLTVTLASLPGPDGQTSLREAVCAANNTAGDDTITFTVNGTFALTGAANEDNGGSGDLDIKQGLAITGNGPTNTIIDGGGIERIFDVFPSAPSTFGLTGLTVQNGDTRTTTFKDGGALYLHNNVTTTLTNVRVQNNFSGSSGAIENRGILSITDSTISGNQTIPAAGNVVGGGIRNAGSLTITNSTIANNTVRGEGGGIATTTSAAVTVSISNTTISGNIASVTGGGLGNGGGISTTGNEGTLNLTNVTISGNTADNNGGGAYFVTPAGGTVNLNNVTIAANVADADNSSAGTGGGISQNTSVVTLQNTLVATNTNSPSVRDDISGTVAGASANNLVGDGTGLAGITNGVNANLIGSGATPIDPMIGPLAANGGSTNTHALLASSPAINAGNAGTCAPLDQRGTARAGVCDIGAYELNDAIPPDTTLTVVPTNPSNSTTASFSFTGSDTGGSGLAGFECALDGSGFTSCTSPQVHSSLSDGSHTFQVRAIDGVGNVDPTPASYTWSIDSVAPQTTIDTNPTNPSTSTTADFTFSGTDVGGSGIASFECRLGVAAFAPCTSPFQLIGLTDGSNTFEVRAVDVAGNVDATPASFTWVIDTLAPDTSITAFPPNPSASTVGNFQFTGGDGSGTGVALFQCRVDGGSFSTCTSPHATAGLGQGSHTFEVRAVDGAGNVDASPASYTWVIDTIAPDTTITVNPADPSATDDPSFSFVGDDGAGSGVVSYECDIDGAGFTSCTSPQAYLGLADGSHTFQVRATDAAGNTDATPDSFTWLIDTVAPDTTITVTPPSTSSSTNASFSFVGSDVGGSGVASFECQIDGAGFVSCTSPQAYTALADGSHTFEVRAIDAAGNTDASPASFTWIIDATPPDTTITGSPANPSASASATLMFTGADPGGGTVVSFECQLDGGGFAACTSPQAYTSLADGSHTFDVRAIDNEGNIDPTPATFTWLVDATAPTTTITANPANPSASGDASFSFTGGDAGGSGVVSFECKLDTGDYAACTSPRSYAALADGSHTFQVRAIDAAGNVDSTPALFTWSIDTVAPSTTITSGPPATTTSTSATFTFTGTDPSAFECSLDGAAFQPCTSPHVLNGLSVGSHTFRVRAVDAAGNVDATPASFSWAVTAVPVAPTTTIRMGTPLPDTGASHTQDWLLVGLLLAGSGTMLLAVRRRRSNA